MSAPVHPKSVCVFLPPRVTLPTCCHCCHLLWTGGIQQPYSAWNKFQLPNFYSSLNFDFIIANKLLLIPLFHILSLYEESFLIAVRLTFAHGHSLNHLYQTNQTPSCLSVWVSRWLYLKIFIKWFHYFSYYFKVINILGQIMISITEE